MYENGVYYRTPEQRAAARNPEYSSARFCMYPYFPRTEGMLSDGINAFSPEYQPGEFFDALGTNEEPGPWYPMYSYSEMLSSESEVGRVWEQMNRVKREYLPRIIMTDDFDGMWKQYMEDYEFCQPEIFLAEMQKELEHRNMP